MASQEWRSGAEAMQMIKEKRKIEAALGLCPQCGSNDPKCVYHTQKKKKDTQRTTTKDTEPNESQKEDTTEDTQMKTTEDTQKKTTED